MRLNKQARDCKKDIKYGLSFPHDVVLLLSSLESKMANAGRPLWFSIIFVYMSVVFVV